jgi:hypothetical protein
VSPAFLRELARKAALQAALDESEKVEDRHFGAALALLDSGGPITRAMLGADAGEAARRLDPHDLGGGSWGGGFGGDIIIDES